MGILARIKAALTSAPTPPTSAPSDDDSQQPTPRVHVTRTAGTIGPLHPLSGTTTFTRDAVDAFLARRGLELPAHVEMDGIAQREPANPADPAAVAVLVDGEPIGYLPHPVAVRLDPPTDASLSVRVQLFAKEQDGRARAAAWVWLEDSTPRWQFSADKWPPITRTETRVDGHLERREMVSDALANGGARADAFRAGTVENIHYLELVEPIKQLKREGRLEEALELCYVAITGAEAQHAHDRLTPPPAYTEHAAIILRKLRRHDEERAVLRRYLALLPKDQRAGSRIGERLAKLDRLRWPLLDAGSDGPA
ncbi:hypothetical protein [Cellulosimicrobium cellulans]|uniref:hypothetical protein n=1 Tax=Cellulosimicrobium cellulans TaxID=1710 RepID=UPI00130EE38A|nr:hypothetical protein [Cellulosimicrobium cellulans]